MRVGETTRIGQFLDTTEPSERDRIAYIAFERAIHDAVRCASLLVSDAEGSERQREGVGLTLAVGGMLFRVLSRVDLGTVIAGVQGIGYAVRYALLDVRSDALDDIGDADAYEDLAARGYAADQADSACVRSTATRGTGDAVPARDTH
jgi:hypothetical protein